MKIRKCEGEVIDKAEGLCCGYPYDTQLASAAGVSIHFWVDPSVLYKNTLEEALNAARRARDVVSASYSIGKPTAFWAHSDIN